MPTEIKVLSELDKILKENKVKYISLWDNEGKGVFTQNATPAGMQPRKKEIFEFLNSSLASPGFYTIKLKNNPQKQGAAMDILYCKPGAVAENYTPQIDHARTHFLSYDRALELEKKIAELTYACATKDIEIEKLKSDVEELQYELQQYEAEEPPATTATPAQPVLTEGQPATPGTPGADLYGIGKHIPSILGVVDTWFAIKKKELEIKEKQFEIQKAEPAPKEPEPVKQINEADAIDLTGQTLEYLKENKPELLEQIISKYGRGKEE